jgi:glycyl-tRNA synthetase alpha subunit
MYVFDKKTVYDLPFNRADSEVPLTYGDVFLQNERSSRPTISSMPTPRSRRACRRARRMI